MGDFWLIRSKMQIKDRLRAFEHFLNETWNWESPVAWKVSVYRDARSLSQNNLFHMWCSEMADHFTDRGTPVTQEDMKDLMKLKFLGLEDRVINETVIPQQLRETRKLDRGTMLHFMNQVQEWGLDHGVNLTAPHNSEYMQLSRGG